ncbi:MAG: FimB/Mfa2 family fimbrial subunit [Rikenellaceae bacterium]|nr:FimB/Mfa2 family fimbrial subunit [Rikenellaceae bacterium]
MEQRLYKITMVLALIFLAPGCDLLQDDLSNCPTDEGRTYRIFFPLAGGTDSDIDPQDVKQLSLYVFDRYGYYVTYVQDDAPRLDDENYCITLDLETDERYLFVAWGNMAPDYGYSLDNDPNDLIGRWYVRLDDPGAEHLLYGYLDAPATRADGTVDYAVEINQNTYTVHITTEGFPDPGDNHTLDLTHGLVGYSFMKEPVVSYPVTYTTNCGRDAAGQPSVSARTYGLDAGSDTTLELYNADKGNKLFEDSLLSLINEANRQGAAIDFSLVHNFYIHLKYNDTSMEVEVSLNGWNITYEYHELG